MVEKELYYYKIPITDKYIVRLYYITNTYSCEQYFCIDKDLKPK